jgi:mono/diheme cytochrome c family protein
LRALPAPRLPSLASAALAAWALLSAGPRTAAADPETLAQGEQVMRRFCLSCHGAPGGQPADPLGPRLRPEVWPDAGQAYENVGQLWRINRRMDQPFTGSDADRRALAAWLAHRAEQNRTPPWKVALPWVAAGAGLLAALWFLLRARRRGPGSR